MTGNFPQSIRRIKRPRTGRALSARLFASGTMPGNLAAESFPHRRIWRRMRANQGLMVGRREIASRILRTGKNQHKTSDSNASNHQTDMHAKSILHNTD